jgi:DnaK suppressor protein
VTASTPETYTVAIEAAVAETQASLTLAREDARPVAPDNSLGRLTRLDAMQQQQMALARVGRLEARLRALDGAKSRLNDQSFGECVRCGDAIPEARLLARPEAALCLRCERG